MGAAAAGARAADGTTAAAGPWVPGTIDSGAFEPAGGALAVADGFGGVGAGRAALRGAGTGGGADVICCGCCGETGAASAVLG
jgi:hypothetical protein